MLRNVVLFAGLFVMLTANVQGADAPLVKELERLHIPAKLFPKQKQPLFLVRAEGVQSYHAEEKGSKLEWVFQSPRATLMDYRTGEKVGTHSKEPEGPIWVAIDGSKLTGKLLESNPAPNPDAIPWLLLEVKNDGGGQYAKVTHIQRVDTWAGKAPAAPPAEVGMTKEVRYQATYVFWGEN